MVGRCAQRFLRVLQPEDCFQLDQAEHAASKAEPHDVVLEARELSGNHRPDGGQPESVPEAVQQVLLADARVAEGSR
jgi:hypothetical protein